MMSVRACLCVWELVIDRCLDGLFIRVLFRKTWSETRTKIRSMLSLKWIRVEKKSKLISLTVSIQFCFVHCHPFRIHRNQIRLILSILETVSLSNNTFLVVVIFIVLSNACLIYSRQTDISGELLKKKRLVWEPHSSGTNSTWTQNFCETFSFYNNSLFSFIYSALYFCSILSIPTGLTQSILCTDSFPLIRILRDIRWPLWRVNLRAGAPFNLCLFFFFCSKKKLNVTKRISNFLPSHLANIQVIYGNLLECIGFDHPKQ